MRFIAHRRKTCKAEPIALTKGPSIMRKSSWMSAIAAAVIALTASGGFAQTFSVIPFSDDFEAYTNLTPLVNGTNGWYGSSNDIVVQTNTVSTGTNAAMIPEDDALTNLFVNTAEITNVWVQTDLRPVFYAPTNPPVVDANKAVLFYIKSNGNFVVHNGPASPSVTNSTNWVESAQGGVGTNGTNWVSVQIRLNYANHSWGLYNVTTNSHVLVANNIRFSNTNLTSFTGFSVYNGMTTSFIDNVSVTNPPPVNPYLSVTPAGATNLVIRGYPTNIDLTISNQGETGMNWTASTVAPWIGMGPTTGSVAAGNTTTLAVTNSSVALVAGSYTGSVTVAATSEDTFLDPESVTVTFVLQVMELQRAPAQLTNAVMQGEWGADSFRVWNAGPGVLTYTVATNQPWMVLSQTAGSLTGQTANATNTIVVTYTNTAGLALGENHGTITITATDGGSETMSATLNVILTVRAAPMLNVSPSSITKTTMEGQNAASQFMQVWNGSADYGIVYQIATNQGNAGTNWLAVLATNNYSLAPLATNILTISYPALGSLRSAGDVPSNYPGSITIAATTATPGSLPATGSPVTIPVTAQVNPRSRLALSLTNLSQTVLQGRDAASQGFDVWNANGFYTLRYTVSKGLTPWLVLTSSSGSSTGQHMRVEVQYSTANLPVGTTNALITVVGRAWDGTHEDSARDATQYVAVALSVTPFATLATDAHAEYDYTVRKGTTPPDSVVHVWNGGNMPGAMFFTVTPSVSWLSVTPASGTSTGNMVAVRVQADTTDMAPEIVYRGTVQIDAIDSGSGKLAYGSPQTFKIAITLHSFKGFDFQGGLSGASDLVLYREANGAWEIRNLLSNYAATQYLGGVGYQAVPGDYTGDGITWMGIYRPASGSWYAQQVGETSARVIELQQWSGDDFVGMPGDYDGDGKTDPAVYLEKTGLWMLLLSGSGYQQVSGIFGGPGYAPLQSGDYDGDGKVDIGVYHRTSGLWFLFFSTSRSVVSGTFGGTGFVPVPTDYDGDGLTDPAVYETAAGRWYIAPSTTLTDRGYGLAIYPFGGEALSSTLAPAPGNYDGAGGADLALYDTARWRWYIITLDGVPLAWDYPMGRLGDIPVLP